MAPLHSTAFKASNLSRTHRRAYDSFVARHVRDAVECTKTSGLNPDAFLGFTEPTTSSPSSGRLISYIEKTLSNPTGTSASDFHAPWSWPSERSCNQSVS